ncbi:MAG: hypothetical protein O3C43_19235 [Verrucomicrobia bacterium]|nr:hypothetical protein [Verrucomicrobiota bacterium]MDA1068624.1 hypothetical protein [Verrucomicrobiota bacterium]
MNKSAKLQAAIEIISALAVVITLIFLLIEIRQNTEQTALNARAVQMAAYQDLMSQISGMNTLHIENPQFAEVWYKFEKRAELTAIEKSQIDQFVWMLTRHGDLAYYQFELGAINEERLLSALGPFTGRLLHPSIREMWNDRKGSFVPGFRGYIDNYLTDRDLKQAARASTEQAQPSGEAPNE